jgi:hypothetical protein
MLRSYLAIGPVVARPANDGSRPVQFRSQLSRPAAGKRRNLATPFRPASLRRERWRLSHRSIIGTTKRLSYFMFLSFSVFTALVE